MDKGDSIYLSIVLPVRNEEKNLEEIQARLLKVGDEIGKPFEIIYVENGSTDRTVKILQTLKKCKIIILRWGPNIKSGQSAALDAGVKAAKGKFIATIDADMQNPPEEIPKMLNMLLEQDLDVVSGWRKKRKDSFFIKNLSRFGSLLRTRFINPGVHDLGCTLKIYRRECFEGLDLYGEMHRYTVALLKWRGFRIGEMVVEHEHRKNGKSNYNWKKMFRGFVDMWSVWFWMKYSDRPLHLFGVLGVFLSMVGFGLISLLGLLRIFGLVSLTNTIWTIISVLLMILGVQFFVFGMLMDMLIRNYYVNGEKKRYYVKEVIEN